MRMVDWEAIETSINRRIEEGRDALERQTNEFVSAAIRGRIAALREVLLLPDMTAEVEGSDRVHTPPHDED